jgi:hypothetical protein
MKVWLGDWKEGKERRWARGREGGEGGK